MHISLQQRQDYQFDVSFGAAVPPLLADEPAPLGVPAASLEHLDRVLEQFEGFCTVTQSVGQGIAVVIEVFDSNQLRLKPR